MKCKQWESHELNLFKNLCKEGKYTYPQMIEKYFPNRTYSSLAHAAEKYGYKSQFVNKKYSHDLQFFSTPNLLNSYYSGFIAADGSLVPHSNGGGGNHTLKIALQKRDINILEQFVKHTKFDGEIKEYMNTCSLSKTGKKSPIAYIQIHSCPEWKESLEKNFSVTPYKKYRLAPPISLDINNQIAYLVGYTDGDGSITGNHKSNKPSTISISWSSASIKILEWVREFTSCLINVPTEKLPSIFKCKTSEAYVYMMHSLTAAKIIHILKHCDVPKLSRKWDNPKIIEKLDKTIAKNQQIFDDLINKIYNPPDFSVSPIDKNIAALAA